MLLDLRYFKQDRPRAGTPGPAGTDVTEGTPISSETDWLVGPRLLRSIGSAYDNAVPERFFEEVSLPEAFDLLIYFQEAEASNLLPPPSPPPP